MPSIFPVLSAEYRRNSTKARSVPVTQKIQFSSKQEKKQKINLKKKKKKEEITPFVWGNTKAMTKKKNIA